MVAVALLLAAGASRGGTAGVDAERVLELVAALADERPFTVDGVAAVLGLDAGRAEGREGRWFRYATIDDTAGVTPFARTEVRQRLAVEPGRDGLVVLELRPGPCIDRQAVMARHGPDPALSIPSVHQGPISPVYLVYPKAWGKISFGFAADAGDCLVSVVLDATGA